MSSSMRNSLSKPFDPYEEEKDRKLREKRERAAAARRDAIEALRQHREEKLRESSQPRGEERRAAMGDRRNGDVDRQRSRKDEKAVGKKTVRELELEISGTRRSQEDDLSKSLRRETTGEGESLSHSSLLLRSRPTPLSSSSSALSPSKSSAIALERRRLTPDLGGSSPLFDRRRRDEEEREGKESDQVERRDQEGLEEEVEGEVDTLVLSPDSSPSFSSGYQKEGRGNNVERREKRTEEKRERREAEERRTEGYEEETEERVAPRRVKEPKSPASSSSSGLTKRRLPQKETVNNGDGGEEGPSSPIASEYSVASSSFSTSSRRRLGSRRERERERERRGRGEKESGRRRDRLADIHSFLDQIEEVEREPSTVYSQSMTGREREGEGEGEIEHSLALSPSNASIYSSASAFEREQRKRTSLSSSSSAVNAANALAAFTIEQPDALLDANSTVSSSAATVYEEVVSNDELRFS